MREIKFRFWDTDGQMSKPFRLQETTGYENWDKLIPMQYTGLKDKNGTEIYEGDIIRCSDSLGRGGHITRIEFYEGSFVGFDEFGIREVISEIIACSNKYDREGVEAMGNIYEHPELIEG